MPKIVLTDEGYNIINTSRTEGGKQFWIGYCGLAYVPEGTALSSNITSLTQDGGDNIYNVFQGSMVAVHAGTDTKVGENSSAYRLANECMYTGNVLTRYRYVLDENDNNRLVVFANSDDMGDPDANHSTGLVEYAVYRNDSIASLDENETAGNGGSLPLPAPLYYGGEPTSYSGLNGDASVEVTHDTRPYSATAHAASMNPGLHGDAPAGADNYDYFASAGNTYSTSMTGIGDALLEKDWQLQSVSNFNRFHAPTNAEGYNQAFEPSCRNMAKATKLFPIAGYDVQTTSPEDDSKVSAVKYTVKINLRDVGDEISKRSTPYYRYENGTFTLVDASEYKVGFKFNRIGIYAVEASLHAYETASDASEPCARQHIQMQIVGESEPKLVAVMDLPTPIVLSDGGSVEYSCDFIFNFVKPDSGLIDDAAIYYNLYEDDAITWYKNQLIANASTAEAVTSLGVQMNYLRQQISRATSDENSKCGIVDTETDEVANSLAASIAKVAGNLSSVSSTVTENTDNIVTLQTGKQDKLTQTGHETRPVFVNAAGEVTACDWHYYNIATKAEMKLKSSVTFNGTAEVEWEHDKGSSQSESVPQGFYPHTMIYNAVVNSPVDVIVRVYELSFYCNNLTDTFTPLPKILSWVGVVKAGLNSVNWTVTFGAFFHYMSNYMVTVQPVSSTSTPFTVSEQYGYWYKLAWGNGLGTEDPRSPGGQPWVDPTA